MNFPPSPRGRARALLVALAGACCAGAAAHGKAAAATAAPAPTAARPSVAVACMSCHGTDGHAEGVGYFIGGRPAPVLAQALLEFKDGRRAGSVMPGIARAFSDAELRSLAEQFSKFR